jgi:hypothetical protein
VDRHRFPKIKHRTSVDGLVDRHRLSDIKHRTNRAANRRKSATIDGARARRWTGIDFPRSNTEQAQRRTATNWSIAFGIAGSCSADNSLTATSPCGVIALPRLRIDTQATRNGWQLVIDEPAFSDAHATTGPVGGLNRGLNRDTHEVSAYRGTPKDPGSKRTLASHSCGTTTHKDAEMRCSASAVRRASVQGKQVMPARRLATRLVSPRSDRSQDGG